MPEISKIQIGNTSYDVADEKVRERVTALENNGGQVETVKYAETAYSATIADKAKKLEHVGLSPSYDDDKIMYADLPATNYLIILILNINNIYRTDLIMTNANGSPISSVTNYVKGESEGYSSDTGLVRWKLTSISEQYAAIVGGIALLMD